MSTETCICTQFFKVKLDLLLETHGISIEKLFINNEAYFAHIDLCHGKNKIPCVKYHVFVKLTFNY